MHILLIVIGVSIHTHMDIYMCIYIDICQLLHIYMCTVINEYRHIRVSLYMLGCRHPYVHIYTNVDMYIDISVYIYNCAYIYACL